MRNLSTTEVKVGLNFGAETISVGRLAARGHEIYFEYDAIFIAQNIEISPLNLPLQAGVSTFDRHLFEGLPGVFNDSLPDGWGRLLFDRFMRKQGILPNDLTPLDRLAHIGALGMGALVFEPDYGFVEIGETINLDMLAAQSQEVLNGNSEDVLQELLALNGSSAGARPKALISMDAAHQKISHGARNLASGYEHWLVKFANSQDGNDAGAIEYVYALMAHEAGINMPDTHLFPAENGAGYFATKRFDRESDKRFHMHTACGLLHSDFRTPSLDYEDLIALTGHLTRDVREIEKMFRLAVFNVLAHNRDDHSKNFSFLMNDTGDWKLSPAYDLTFSSGPRGEQSTMVLGEGKKPTPDHLIKLGRDAQLSQSKIDTIIEQTRGALGRWQQLATEFGVSQININLIGAKISGQ
ncbi:MAG: phosphatidylinositol kinase [Hyphomicrobiales bacterium]|nr:MAG: phosphatidylinositol kinase [Hyphomicrobiales bacterium]